MTLPYLGSQPIECPDVVWNEYSPREIPETLHNLQLFDKPASRVAPYGIFPLDHKSCFDLITGEIILFTTINLDCLQARYNGFGLELDLPRPTKQEIEAYSTASIAERKKLMHLGKFFLRDGDLYVSQIPDYSAGRIGIELMHEDTIVQADRQLMNLIKELQIPGQAVRFYTGYVDESGVWV
jgi:hypothetical protein